MKNEKSHLATILQFMPNYSEIFKRELHNWSSIWSYPTIQNWEGKMQLTLEFIIMEILPSNDPESLKHQATEENKLKY